MARDERIAVATGRFQTIHTGSLAYLSAFKDAAERQSEQLYVLTGPLDSELETHANRDESKLPRRGLKFEERRMLLSLMAALPAPRVLNQASSPHHGQADLTRWTQRFFDPLKAALTSEGHAFDAAKVDLYYVRKDIDVTYYGAGREKSHYVDYLLAAYAGLRAIDLAADIALSQGAVSSGAIDLPPSGDRRLSILPPAMSAAELLMPTVPNIAEGQPRACVTAVFHHFGNTPTPAASINAFIADSDQRGAG